MPNVSANCFGCTSRDRSEWCQLSDEDLALLNAAKACRVYGRGEAIFRQGSPCRGLFCIERGIVAIRKSDADGNEVILRFALEGNALGYRAYFANEGYSASAEALTECRVCFIRQDVVTSVLSHNPSLGFSFLGRLAEDLKCAENRQLASNTLPVRARFAHLLLTFKERFACTDKDGSLKIELPISRQDLAAMIGTRPETVTRTTQALEKDGIALFKGREVRVPRLDALLDELELAV